ncbi:hypothetical protein [Sutcliffiella horikoshii]|uniref:hypothetical protein n=1 Tax=Sutcliffiella horikoshii TaxID=79883 RepID=UPI0021CCF956|nr:hypothetical protein [Sutcliffiella horikoshii]
MKGDEGLKKIIYIVLSLSVLLLVGCNSPKTMEEAFHKEMKSLKDVDDYTLVKQIEKDNVILFTSYIEGDEENNEQLNIVHFNKVNNEWFWDKTASCNDKWSGKLGDKPYIWCGTLTEPRHDIVYVGDTKANVIEVEGGIERVWYHLSENDNEEIKVVLADGSEEWLKEVIK